MSRSMILMNAALLIGTFVAFIVFSRIEKAKKDPHYKEKKYASTFKRFTKYYNSILTRGRFRRIVEMYSSLSCFRMEEVRMESVNLFERNMIIVFMFPLIALIVMNNVVVAILMFFMGLVFYESQIEKKMDKIYVEIMQDMSLMLSSVREKFLETNSIPSAIQLCERSEYLEMPMNKIFQMLTNADGEMKLKEFQSTFPIRLMKTFANTCYIVNENGVQHYENGFDSFTSDMTVLRQECDAEVRRLIRQRIAFKSLQTLSLVGLAIMPAFEWYLLHNIPGTSSLLKGFYGEVSHVAIILLTIFMYWYISNCMRPSIVNVVDRNNTINELMQQRWYLKIVENVKSKKAKTEDKLNELINNSLSAKNINYIYGSKVFYATCGFVAGLICLFIFPILIKYNIYHNYNTMTFIEQQVTADQYKKIIEMDNAVMKWSEEEFNSYTEDGLKAFIQGHVTGLTDTQLGDQYDRLTIKFNIYKHAHWYWWFPFIAFLIAVLCWFIPEIQLIIRHSLVQYEEGEDVMQLQTMMIVLSETKFNVYRVISQLEQVSTIHKHALTRCHYSYAADPEKAIRRMEQSTNNKDFKRICRKLISCIYTLSIHDGFSDMLLDKQQSLSLREMLRNEELESRKTTARLLAIVPAASALILSFMGPVLILGIREITETLSSLQGM